MAGDWIKMRADLHTHPKVVRIMSALKADRLRVIGGLHAVWCLFDAHSTDGKLDGYTTDALDILIGWHGFSGAMVNIGWLEVDGESLTTPGFDEHNGQSAKRRAQESERKRTDRKTSASDADKLRTREEKRREEKKEPKSKAERATATRLPSDWHPSEVDTEFCKVERPDLRPSQVASRFFDYWIAQPGTKGRKLDWPATWRNWVRNEKGHPARGSPGFQTSNDKAKTLADRLTGKTRNEPTHEFIDINDRPSAVVD